MMSTVGACQLLALLFPQLGASSPLARLAQANDLSLEERRAIYGHYRQLVQRHLYFVRSWKGIKSARYVCKNPTFTLRLDAVVEEFPDCSLIVAVRNPYSTVPSMVSYISKWWHLFASPMDEYPAKDFLIDLCNLHYQKPLDLARSRPGTIFVKYEDLVKDEASVFSRLLVDLGETNNDATSSGGRSDSMIFTHNYSVEETLGLSEQEFQNKQCRLAFECYPEYRKL